MISKYVGPQEYLSLWEIKLLAGLLQELLQGKVGEGGGRTHLPPFPLTEGLQSQGGTQSHGLFGRGLPRSCPLLFIMEHGQACKNVKLKHSGKKTQSPSPHTIETMNLPDAHAADCDEACVA